MGNTIFIAVVAIIAGIAFLNLKAGITRLEDKIDGR